MQRGCGGAVGTLPVSASDLCVASDRNSILEVLHIEEKESVSSQGYETEGVFLYGCWISSSYSILKF